MNNSSTEVIFVDGIQALGVHNGVARILMMRLGADGKPVGSLELLIPIASMRTVVEGLSKISK